MNGIRVYVTRMLGPVSNRNFRFYLGSQIFSLSGVWMQIVALNWLVYRLTDSPLMLSAVNFLALVPAGLISPLGGVIADRIPRRKLLLITQTVLAVQALVLSVLSYTNSVRIWHLFIIVFVIGIANAIDDPTRLAFLRDIVGGEQFSGAIGLNSFIFNLAGSVGPFLAGLFIAAYGETSCFLINAASYGLVIVALAFIKPIRRVSSIGRLDMKTDLMQGIRYAWRAANVRGLLALIAVLALFIRPYTIILPVFARNVFNADARAYGILLGAVGAGALVGALAAASMPAGRRGRTIVIVSLLAALFMILFSLAGHLRLATVFLFMSSAFATTQLVLTTSLILLNTDDKFHGRIASFQGLVRDGLTRLGGVQAGFVAQFWSAPGAVAAGSTVGAIFFILLLRPFASVKSLK